MFYIIIIIIIIIIITIITAAVVTNVKWDNITNSAFSRKRARGQWQRNETSII